MGVNETNTNVKVLVRIRPQSSRERLEMCEVCVEVDEDNLISLGGPSGRKFTFDRVCGMETNQMDIYELCCTDLIKGLFEGFNASLLAYGQTGSGKTYTMGTNFDLNIDQVNLGILPRVFEQLYINMQHNAEEDVKQGFDPPVYKIYVQFMELYNEEVFDLLDSTTDKMRKSGIRVHEDGEGQIHVTGLKTRQIHSLAEAMSCLKEGTLARSTACTNMNTTSSRSHAVFTLLLHQRRCRKVECEGEDMGELPKVMCEETRGKFNFVDLAGSERLKRTGATGERAREGISINCGLLALGNVISALGDPAKIGCHVPYRDSKLTRILQDSLGGNSQTTMIACVSPSDCDFMETLNTLNYANRARNIKNRLTVDRGVVSESLVTSLRLQVAQLTQQLNQLKQGGSFNNGDVTSENHMLMVENRNLRDKVKATSSALDDITSRNAELLSQLEAVKFLSDPEKEKDIKTQMLPYIKEAEVLRSKLCTADKHLQHLTQLPSKSPFTPRQNMMSQSYHPGVDEPFNKNNDLIRSVRDDIEQLNRIRAEKETLRSKLVTKEQASSEEDDDEEEEDEDDDDLDKLERDLTEISSEINMKQQLIDQLTESHKKMAQLKVNYEEKICNLENKIKLTENERDKILTTMSGKKSSDNDAKNIKKSYESQLSEMKTRLKLLMSERREHRRLMQSHKEGEVRLATLHHQMSLLKKQKVQLMRRLEEEASQSREVQKEMRKKVAQMQKQQRTKDIQVKKLQMERDKKDVVLKRKIEEVEALKRKQQLLNNKKKKSPKKDLLGWENFENMIKAATLKRQAVNQLESDLEKYVKQREQLRVELEQANDDNGEGDDGTSEGIRKELSDVVRNIKQCQQCIVQLEGNKRNDINSLISALNPGDVVCHLEQCVSYAINKGVSLEQQMQLEKDITSRLQYQQQQVEQQRRLIDRLVGEKARYEAANDVRIGDEVITDEKCPEESFEEVKGLEKNEEEEVGREEDEEEEEEKEDDIEFDESSVLENEEGYIEEVDGGDGNDYLEQVRSCIGHYKAVSHVGVHATKLFSAGKDASLKVWDICEGRLIQAYNHHATGVSMSCFSPKRALLFAACAFFVKVYDVRTSKALACLASSGSKLSLSDCNNTSCPTGEMLVNNVLINKSGDFLFTSAGNCVRVWDTRMLKPLSRIQGAHQQAISCMALHDLNPQQCTLATASRDFLIRYYHTNGGVHYASTKGSSSLSQVHKDVVQGMVFNGPNNIFSSSKDKSLVSWNLQSGKYNVVENAHNTWITGLTTTHKDHNTRVITACHNGSMKVWHGASLACLHTHTRAHDSGINCLVAKAGLLFSASNDKSVGVWKIKSLHED